MNQVVTQTPAKGRTRIYACGGAAINIVAGLKNTTVNRDLVSDFEVVLVDTSRSNLSAHSREAECYLVEGLDGSGKVRSENSGAIAERVKDILQQHKPGDLNIILSSGAGGSGSVIGPLLASELLARGVAVIILMVGSTASKLEAENTLKTLKTYEAISQKRDMPVVMHYLQNSPTLIRAKVDQSMISTISYLGMLYSRRNRELDTKDLQNWLNFSKDGLTSFGAQLAVLTILWHDQADGDNTEMKSDLAKLGNIISVATLAPEGVNTDLPQAPEYQTVGILPQIKDGGEQLAGKVISYVISDGLLPQFTKGLNGFLSDLTQAAESRPPKTSILSNTDKVDNTGLVL
jgi:hypothetical protein